MTAAALLLPFVDPPVGLAGSQGRDVNSKSDLTREAKRFNVAGTWPSYRQTARGYVVPDLKCGLRNQARC